MVFYLSGCQQDTAKIKISSAIQNDSLSIWINEVRNDSDLSGDSKKAILEKVVTTAEIHLPDTAKTKIYSQVSLAYRRLGDSSSFRQINTRLMGLSNRIDDYQTLGEAHWDLGDFYNPAKPDSSYYHYKEAHENFLKAELDANAKDYPGRILYAMALVKDNNKDYVGAEKDIVAAIGFFKEKGFNARLFSSYNLLANIQNGLNNLGKALEYHELAGNYIQYNNRDRQYRDSVYNTMNKGVAYIRNENYSKGIELLNTVLSYDSLKFKEPQSYAKGLASLANGQFQNGDPNIEDMKQLIQESNDILDSLGDTFHKARNHEFMAELLAFENDTSQAINMAHAAKRIAEETNNNDRLLTTLQLLTTLDKKNSADHAKAYFNLSDSLQAQERNIRDKFALIAMETDEVIEQNEALARQKRTWIAIAAGLLLFAVAVFTIITLRVNNQKLKFRQKQQESNQEIYNLMLAQQGKIQEGKQLEQKRISEEIHDGILGEMLGIRLILSGLNERNDEAAVAQRAELIDKLQELEEEMRTISHELNDASYQKINNFIVSVADLIKSIGASTELKTEFTHDQNMDWDALDGELKINSYRIVQESMQNCIKHAQCKSIAVDFKVLDEKLIVTIKDDGIGFDKNKGKKGIGLKNIISRVHKMSGALNIDSEIGKGTLVRVEIPIRYQQNGNEKKPGDLKTLQEA